MKNYAAIAALTMLLSACGGGSSGGGSSGTADGSASAMDSFTAYVAQLIGSAPDDTEPVAIDSVAATAPESTEPSPVR